MKIIVCVAFMCVVLSCKKEAEQTTSVDNSPKFVTYTIAKGQNYPNNDSTMLVLTNYDEQKFIVKFDSSAIYTTLQQVHQVDINKLYGFADNNMFHQKYSARFGWNWIRNSLHLWAYIYNDGVVDYKDLGTVTIGNDVYCSIKVTSKRYIFSLNGNETIMPRTSPTSQGVGYKLFPYFGGHETAPHDITIAIKEI